MCRKTQYREKISELERVIDYKFKDMNIAFQALSHSSFANEYSQKYNCNNESNERLEFLGDSVLSLVVSNELFEGYKEVPEGELSKMRAAIVCEASLATFARRIKLEDLILLGSGENVNGGRQRASIISDCLEAVMGAIYKDGGFEEAQKFILNVLGDSIRNCAGKIEKFDYKTTLQEMLQKCNHDVPKYQVIGTDGPDHNKEFTVKVIAGDGMCGIGTGKSKKIAEQNAAKDFINKEYLD